MTDKTERMNELEPAKSSMKERTLGVVAWKAKEQKTNQGTLTESGVWLITAQKSIKRPGWWKGQFALFWRLTTRAGGGLTPTPHPRPDDQGARAFIDRGRGPHAETIQSALTVILKLVIGGLISVISIVLGTVNLQFQGQFVPTSLKPILRIVAAYVMATAWSSCS